VVKVPEVPRPEKKENKTYQDIYDTINQSSIRSGNYEDAKSKNNPLDQLDQFGDQEIDDAPEPEEPFLPTPSPPSYNYSNAPVQQRSGTEIQEVVESLIEEKWEEVLSKVGDINLWKEKMETELTSIKQEIIRTQTHFMNLQRSVLGKVNEYNKNILDVNTEMQALEKVFQKILEPLSTNVKELSKITSKLKKK